MAKDIQRRHEGRIERIPNRGRMPDVFSPWFENFLRPIDDLLFDDFLSPVELRSLARPELTIEETDKEYIISADLPGVSKDDISVDTAGNQITITAVRRWENRRGGRDEEGQQTYRRILMLPNGVENDKIQAVCENGVLRITVPKGESLKTRRINIGGSTGDSPRLGRTDKGGSERGSERASERGSDRDTERTESGGAETH